MVPLTVVNVDAFANGIAAKSSDTAMRIAADENARGIILVLVLLMAVHMRATSI